MSQRRESKPGSFMSPEEWSATAAARRALLARIGHEAFSKLAVEQCDDAVREEARRLAEETTGGVP